MTKRDTNSGETGVKNAITRYKRRCRGVITGWLVSIDFLPYSRYHIHMKTITTLVLGLLLIPSVSFAAPLTNDQANSLIAVVQSSPATPANAFVPLITNFSNITLTQATTLIEVVQATPGVPATAFVNMLIAFTVDSALGSVQTPVVEQPTATTTDASTQPTTPVVDNQPATPEPVVSLPTMETLIINTVDVVDYDGTANVLRILSNKTVNLTDITLPDGITMGEPVMHEAREGSYFKHEGKKLLIHALLVPLTGATGYFSVSITDGVTTVANRVKAM